jgi:hypothetical protein
MIKEIQYIPEPALLFGHDQRLEDPRDGLSLFGPIDKGKPDGIRTGVIGTPQGIKRFKSWVEKIQGPVFAKKPSTARPFFPGFEAVFKTNWKPTPGIAIEIPEEEINKCIYIKESHQRVFETVTLFSEKIIKALQQEETIVDIWFVIIPDDVYKYCRPQSKVESNLSIKSKSVISLKSIRKFLASPSLFNDMNNETIPFQYDVNFHNQLKARLLKYSVSTQIIRESTLAFNEVTNAGGRPTRNLENLQSSIAWALSTAVFYKVGGRPWKLGDIRSGVCYLGLVFKNDDKGKDPRTACCAAQMFLDSGDGVVFKGAVGPWYSPTKGDYHLSKEAANQLITLALESFKNSTGNYPKELFIHGKVRFSDDEWEGFKSATTGVTNLVGVRIQPRVNDLKLFRLDRNPILRGMVYRKNDYSAYLWTKGYIPRLRTYPGREVPQPIFIDVCRGDAPLEVVLRDILALTKLNYNACQFADGVPVTLKFADAVGEILTAGPLDDKQPPLPFRYYI